MRSGLKDRPFHVVSVRSFERAMPRKQLVGKHAHLIDVRRRTHGVPPNLLRRGVGRRHGSNAGPGVWEGDRRLRLVEQLGDPKIEQLDRPLPGHEHVGGFEIAVHDEIFVCVLQGRPHLVQQGNPLVYGQRVLVTVGRDGVAVHVFHDEVRHVVVRKSPVQKGRDVGMIQLRQHLLLQPEAPTGRISVEPDAKKLYGHRLVEAAVRTLGPKHAAHSPPSNFFFQPVGPHPMGRRREGIVRNTFSVLGLVGRGRKRNRLLLQKRRRVRLCRQQAFQFSPQPRTIRTHPIEKRLPLFRRPVERLVKQAIDLLPLRAGQVIHATPSLHPVRYDDCPPWSASIP